MKTRIVRTVTTGGGIYVNGVLYYSGKLTNRIKKMVLVEVDDENLGQVEVYTLGGRKQICTAEKVKKHPFEGE